MKKNHPRGEFVGVSRRPKQLGGFLQCQRRETIEAEVFCLAGLTFGGEGGFNSAFFPVLFVSFLVLALESLGPASRTANKRFSRTVPVRLLL